MKKLIKIILSISLLQLMRILFKYIIFIFINRTLLSDMVVNIIFLLGILIIFYLKKDKLTISLIPSTHKKLYIILSILIISTILFGLWHIGYVDTIIWRTSLFNMNANILNIMFWKVITGMILGTIFGFIGYKSKDVYSSILMHSLINMIGS